MKKAINVFIIFLVLVLVALIAWQYFLGSNNVETPETTPEPSSAPVITELMLTINEPYAYFDGERVMIDEENPKIMPTIVGERTMLPLRFIAESFNMDIEWSDETRTVTLTANDGLKIELMIDNRIALVNDNQVELDSPAMILEERTFLPVRFIAEQMDCVVDYNSDTMEITITYNNVALIPEALAERKLLIQDRMTAMRLAKAAAVLCTQDGKYRDSIEFSQEVIIDIELVRPYLPDPTADLSVISTGVAPWIVSTIEGEYKITDSSPEKTVYFRGGWVNITPPPTPTPLPSPTSTLNPSTSPSPAPTKTPNV